MSQMTMEEAKAILATKGWEVLEHDESQPHIVWIRLGTRHMRRHNLNYHRLEKHGKAPVTRWENHLPSADGCRGQFRYVEHGTTDEACIQDYADDKGRAEWPDYVVETQGGHVVREGPKPFRNADERRRYEALTGLRQREPGEPYKRK